MEQAAIEVINERINALRREEEIIHGQLVEQIRMVSNLLVEERRRTNGSLEEIRNEIKGIREIFENKIENVRLAFEDKIDKLEKKMLSVQMANTTNKKESWRNSFIITFLSTLCGILLTLFFTRGL